MSSRPFVVRGQSMQPTLSSGDHVLVDQHAYIRTPPSRSDLVLIRSPGERRLMLKRVVGLPNEHVAYKDGWLMIDGEHLREPYLGGLPASVGLDGWGFDLDEGQYLVLGDNRARSSDGRQFGPIDPSQIIGPVWMRYWPIGSYGPIA